MTFSPGPASFIRGPKSALPSNTRGGSRVPEWGPLGSVRGALSNERPYRDLRNAAINYPFVRAHRFAGIQPNSGRRDYSRLSCAAGEMPLGPRAAGIFSKRCAPKWPSSGHCTFRLFCLALHLTFYVAGSSSESLFHPAADVFGIRAVSPRPDAVRQSPERGAPADNRRWP